MDNERWKGASKRGWVEKYQNLTRQIQKMWGVRTMMMPIVVGALGMILLTLKENQRTIGVDASIQLIPKYALWCQQGSLGKFWKCRLSKSKVKDTSWWLLAGVDENRIWHLYVRVLAIIITIIIIIINFTNFLETGLEIGILGFVGNTGSIQLINGSSWRLCVLKILDGVT